MSSLRETVENKEVGLIDILDVILDKGVAIKGDLIISIAGVDLVYLDLRVLISSVETLVQSYENDRSGVTSNNFDEQRRELVNATGQPDKWTD
ncbi:gas vesicle protein [Halobacillus naozhouensis]|uniref:Gas vesicle protein n=1 Tax=Halobacillus naozhouensis TaxID=554880 RepID=A0ABY8IZQ8_9BACI|nr:gas vesicle protein [Halobacillus naozhouensis]WFT75733.1 gas vesicle protein [Halobacillus naozhouensis]